MTGKNNKAAFQKKCSNNYERFSIRKMKVGAASVAIATGMLLAVGQGSVEAAEMKVDNIVLDYADSQGVLADGRKFASQYITEIDSADIRSAYWVVRPDAYAQGSQKGDYKTSGQLAIVDQSGVAHQIEVSMIIKQDNAIIVPEAKPETAPQTDDNLTDNVAPVEAVTPESAKLVEDAYIIKGDASALQPPQRYIENFDQLPAGTRATWLRYPDYLGRTNKDDRFMDTSGQMSIRYPNGKTETLNVPILITNEVPTAEEAPIKIPNLEPEVSLPPVEEEIPAESETPVEEEIPVESETPAEEEIPAEEETPVEEEIPAESETPVEEEIPAEEEAPAEEEIPAESETPVEEEIPAEEETPVEEEVPAEEEAPVEEEIPAESETPVEEEIPAESETPVEEEVPAEEEASEKLEPIIADNLSINIGDASAIQPPSKFVANYDELPKGTIVSWTVYPDYNGLSNPNGSFVDHSGILSVRIPQGQSYTFNVPVNIVRPVVEVPETPVEETPEIPAEPVELVPTLVEDAVYTVGDSSVIQNPSKYIANFDKLPTGSSASWLIYPDYNGRTSSEASFVDTSGILNVRVAGGETYKLNVPINFVRPVVEVPETPVEETPETPAEPVELVPTLVEDAVYTVGDSSVIQNPSKYIANFDKLPTGSSASWLIYPDYNGRTSSEASFVDTSGILNVRVAGGETYKLNVPINFVRPVVEVPETPVEETPEIPAEPVELVPVLVENKVIEVGDSTVTQNPTDFIANFDQLPQGSTATWLVYPDYNGRSNAALSFVDTTGLLNVRVAGGATYQLNVPINFVRPLSPINPAPGAPLQPIEDPNVETETYTNESVVQYDTIKQSDNTLAPGQYRVIQAGKDGQQIETYERKIKDGEVISEMLIDTEIIIPPVNEIIAIGSMAEAPSVINPGQETTAPDATANEAYVKADDYKTETNTWTDAIQTAFDQAAKKSASQVGPHTTKFGSQFWMGPRHTVTITPGDYTLTDTIKVGDYVDFDFTGSSFRAEAGREQQYDAFDAIGNSHYNVYKLPKLHNFRRGLVFSTNNLDRAIIKIEGGGFYDMVVGVDDVSYQDSRSTEIEVSGFESVGTDQAIRLHADNAHVHDFYIEHQGGQIAPIFSQSRMHIENGVFEVKEGVTPVQTHDLGFVEAWTHSEPERLINPATGLTEDQEPSSPQNRQYGGIVGANNRGLLLNDLTVIGQVPLVQWEGEFWQRNNTSNALHNMVSVRDINFINPADHVITVNRDLPSNISLENLYGFTPEVGKELIYMSPLSTSTTYNYHSDNKDAQQINEHQVASEAWQYSIYIGNGVWSANADNISNDASIAQFVETNYNDGRIIQSSDKEEAINLLPEVSKNRLASSEWINASDFLDKGETAAQAINQAIEYASSVSTPLIRSVVTINPGTYKINETIVVPDNVDIEFHDSKFVSTQEASRGGVGIQAEVANSLHSLPEMIGFDYAYKFDANGKAANLYINGGGFYNNNYDIHDTSFAASGLADVHITNVRSGLSTTFATLHSDDALIEDFWIYASEADAPAIYSVADLRLSNFIFIPRPSNEAASQITDKTWVAQYNNVAGMTEAQKNKRGVIMDHGVLGGEKGSVVAIRWYGKKTAGPSTNGDLGNHIIIRDTQVEVGNVGIDPHAAIAIESGADLPSYIELDMINGMSTGTDGYIAMHPNATRKHVGAAPGEYVIFYPVSASNTIPGYPALTNALTLDEHVYQTVPLQFDINEDSFVEDMRIEDKVFGTVTDTNGNTYQVIVDAI